MIRTHVLPCRLTHADAAALNRESGRIYTQTLIWQYRIYRRKGIWLSPGASARLNDSLSHATLHCHSRDAAQQAFYKACKRTRATRHLGTKYPHKRKFYRTTVWKNTGIRVRGDRLLLARARGLTPITVPMPPDLATLPPQAFVEMRLVYDRVARRYAWHLVIDDGLVPPAAPGDKTLAADLGEIHPAAVANERGEVVIFTARDLRAVNQYRHKKLSTLQARQAQCTKGSRLWKRLQQRKIRLLARNNRQRQDIEHKITRAITTYAKAEGAWRLVIGDIRNIADGKRLRANAQQKISGWSHGRQIAFLRYKLAAEGITLERQNESYSSRTCCACGAQNKARGRTYTCATCGLVCHRDANGAVNQESKALYGGYSHIQPRSVMYRRVFRRSSSRHEARSLGQPLQEAAGLARAECHNLQDDRLVNKPPLSSNINEGIPSMQDLHDYEQLPILGHLIWYGLAGIKTDRATLLHLLTQHGFQGYAPEPPTDKLALQRALREWIRQRGITQRHAGDDEDETATRALIRPINKRRAKYAVYAVVAEEVDFALLGLYHGTSMRILLEKLEPEERAQRQPKLICTTDALGEIAAENEARQVTDELRPIWETYRHLYLSEDLGRMMRAIVEGIPNTIRTRKGGTVYFVPASEKQTLLAFQQLIEALPVDRGSVYTPHLIMVPIVDEAHARQELARAVHIGFVADLEALDKDLDDLRSKVKHVSPDAIARRLDKFRAVRDRARTYATLLSLQQETIAEKIDTLHQKATAMLTESDDEPLPEAAVSVTTLPQQKSARPIAPAIASLIDDDPEAPF